METSKDGKNMDNSQKSRNATRCGQYDQFVLKKRRQRLGLTQQELADRAGIQLKQYQRFEYGDRELSNAGFQTTYKVLAALEMDIAKYAAGEYEIRELIYRGHDGNLYNFETDEPVEM